MTVQEFYNQSIKPLPPANRLELATLILNDIPPQSVVDYREDWSDEDLQDFTKTTWAHIDCELGDEANGQTR